MIKNLALYSTAFLAMAIYLLSCSESVMKFLTEGWRNEDRPQSLHIDKNKYGDLYGMSYLPEFKAPVGSVYVDERIAAAADASIDLYVIGDSFLAHALESEKDVKFLTNTRLKSFWWGYKNKENKTVVLDKTKINVLLIEVAERFFRQNFSGRSKYPESVLKVYQTSPANQGHQETQAVRSKAGPLASLVNLSQKRIVSENQSQNLQLMFFGYEVFGPVKELKAELNFRLFSRTQPWVHVSRDNKNLFLAETISPDLASSSFKPLGDEEVENIVKNINFVAEEYKKKGFDQVIFSIAPNAVTIVDPKMMSYNNLIPRIQNHPNLKVSMVDAYSKMVNSENPADFYWRGDTHWNSRGFKLWVDETNRILTNFSK